LFALAEGGERSLFRQALDRFCGGKMDDRTTALVAERG
jgi:uncharacterized protein (DUF1810 family)